MHGFSQEQLDQIKECQAEGGKISFVISDCVVEYFAPEFKGSYHAITVRNKDIGDFWIQDKLSLDLCMLVAHIYIELVSKNP